MIHGILPSGLHNFYKNWQLIAILGLFLMGCAPTIKEQKPISEDEKIFSHGMAILADPEATDKSAALAAFISACELGSNNGCHNVGTAFNNGLYGKEKDYEQAKLWYEKAASKDFIPSQLNIANIYAHRLLPLDDETGYAWLVRAGEGLRTCRPGSIEGDSKTTADERNRLCRLARSFHHRLQGIFRKRMEGEAMEIIEKTVLKDATNNPRDMFRADQ